MNDSLDLTLDRYHRLLENAPVTKEMGKVTRVTGTMIEGYLPGAGIGSICQVDPGHGVEPVSVEVVGLQDQRVIMMPFGSVSGIRLGSPILLSRSSATVKVGERLLGRVIDAKGNPLDGKGKLYTDEEVSLYSHIVNPLTRKPIDEPLDLGVRAINAMITVGEGQRVAIMAGSGVGKSVLLGMMAKNSNADINVIALIGERGREVREFIENILGEEGLKRSIVIVATGDENALVRMRGAFLATCIAEYFANRGLKVLLTMDSVTRFAMAQREIGLASGEPPTTKGYTPSVFSLLPKLLERAGRFDNGGSITGLYTVLVEGDDMDEPIADSVRSIVDGHIVLRRALAERGHFPAIDVLSSASRLMRTVNSKEQYGQAIKVREMMATYKEAEDLINIGAYQEGSNPKIDTAIDVIEDIRNFLKQSIEEVSDMNECHERMAYLASRIGR